MLQTAGYEGDGPLGRMPGPIQIEVPSFRRANAPFVGRDSAFLPS